MELSLAGRRALVTGGSAGIGLAVARALAAEGCHVAIAARDPARLADACAAIRDAAAAAPVVVGVEADLGRAGGPEHAVARAVAELGGLDVLVNNVGVARQATFGEVEDDDWLRSFEINVLAHVRAIRAALPELRRSPQARIVNVASTAGKRPSQNMADYSVMKAAMLSLSRLVADAEAGNGVLCNAVCPGPALTPAWLAPGGLADQAAARSGATRDEVLQRTGAGRPLGRMAEPDEIAPIVVLLASKAASYVTGAAWGADGGTVPVII
jgi:NAD(P)-dependent dehydrogenase (short-subunit alcohol dehydrogenase family)